MKHIRRPLIAILSVMVLFATSNCTYKNAQDVYPVDTSNCVTANMSFAKDIVPILDSACYGCHSMKNASLGDGYVLEGYANDTLYVNKASDDILYGYIVDPKLTDISHMPQGLPSLSPCEIAKIKGWIDQGYKNN